MNRKHSRFKTTFPHSSELEKLKFLKEDTNAYALFAWYNERITELFRYRGLVIAGVHSLFPLRDAEIASDLRRHGAPFRAEGVRAARERLAASGRIAYLRHLEGGLVSFVIRPEAPTENCRPLPESFSEGIDDLLRETLGPEASALAAIEELAVSRPDIREALSSALTKRLMSLARNDKGEDPTRIELLRDIRLVFDTAKESDLPAMTRKIDRISSKRLAEGLSAIEGRPWAEWSKRLPISPSQISRMLNIYGISSKGLRIDGRVVKGYDLAQFVKVWETYLPPNGQNLATIDQKPA